MGKKGIVESVSLEVLAKTLEEVCKKSSEAAIVGTAATGAAVTAGVSLPIIAVGALAGYIGLAAYNAYGKSKSDKKLQEVLGDILTNTKITQTKQESLEELLPEYYEFFDANMDRQQILERIKMLQNVAASSKAALDSQDAAQEEIKKQLKQQKELLDEFNVFLNVNFEDFKGEIKKIVGQKLFEQLKTLFDKRPCLKSNIYSIEDKNRDYPLFRYQYRWVECVGREQEFKRLDRFLEREEKLLWWAITGNGGVGKSRLAQELCLKQRGRNWYAGFLDDSQSFEQWNNWEPDGPTLIVVDYTDKRAEDIGRQLKSLYEPSKNWNYPVRVLLLDRDGKDGQGNWKDKFLKAGDLPLNYHVNYKEADSENETLVLEGLKYENIVEMIDQIFKKRKAVLTEAKKREIFEAIPIIDEKRRPLYIAFIADACAGGKTVRDWNKKHLHEHILEHYKKVWRKTVDYEKNEIDRKHYNLLVLATMCNGINVPHGETIESFTSKLAKQIGNNILPCEQNLVHEFDYVKYRILSDSHDIKSLHPLEPDILGECFVLTEWEDKKRKPLIDKLWQMAWEGNPFGTALFLTLLFIDFKDDIDYEKIKISPANTLNKNCRKAWAQSLFNIIFIYTEEGKFDKAIKYHNSLHELWQYHTEDKNITIFLAKAMVNLIFEYGEDGQLIKATEYFDRLENLWQYHRNDSDVSLTLSSGALNLVIYYSNGGYLDKAVEYYNRIEHLWQDYKKDKNISLVLGNAAVNLTKCYYKKGQLDKATEYYDKIEKLWQNYREDKEIAITLSKAALNLTNAYGQKSKFNQADKYYKRLEYFLRKYKTDKDICIRVANTACNMTNYYREKGLLNKAVEYYDKIEKLWQENGKDKEISLRLGKAIVNLINAFNDYGKIEKSTQYFNRLQKLWQDYRKDRDISETLAIAMFNLVNYYGTVKLDDATRYYNSMDALWQDYKEDKEISLKLAQAAFNLSIDYAAGGNLNKATEYYGRLDALWQYHKEDKEISLELVKVAVNLASNYGKANQLEKSVYYYGQVEKLWEFYKEDKDITHAFAISAFNLTKHYGKDGQLDKASECYNQIKQLWHAYKKDKDITLVFAKAAFIMLSNYGENGQLEKSTEFYNDIQQLWCECIKDKEISLEFAMAAVNLINYSGTAGQLEKAAEYYGWLDALWQDYKEDKDISLELARAATICVVFNKENNISEGTEKYLKRFDELKKKFSGDEEMAKLAEILEKNYRDKA